MAYLLSVGGHERAAFASSGGGSSGSMRGVAAAVGLAAGGHRIAHGERYVSEHVCVHARECSCEAAHVGDCAPCSCTGAAIRQFIDS